MAYSDAQKEATKRYNKKAYDRIDLFVKKGKRQMIKEIAGAVNFEHCYHHYIILSTV